MARINLLPWREERRAERKKQFLTTLGAVAVFGVLCVFVADRVINAAISEQASRNSYLQRNIALLDAEVAEIRDLQRNRTQLIERMRVIQELQGNRPIIVRILDQLVKTLPDGVFYTSLTTQEGTIAIDGVAESNNRVSSLMRNLDASPWLQDPNLAGVRAAPEYGEQATVFSLSVQVQLPDETAVGETP
jgi:type IV pilus assembly protein PilN